MEEVQRSAELVEVGFLLWILLSSTDFDVSELTLSGLEQGVFQPRESELIGRVHTLLLLKGKKLRSKIQLKEFEWWSYQLKKTIKTWIADRRDIAFDLKRMLEDDDQEGDKCEEDMFDDELVNNLKTRIAELDQLLDPILGKNARIPERVALKEDETEKEAILESAAPFKTKTDFLELAPVQRLHILRALCVWRANGYPEHSMQKRLRGFDEDSLRMLPIGEDVDGNRFFYFHQFLGDFRIYKETPADDTDLEALSAKIQAEVKAMARAKQTLKEMEKEKETGNKSEVKEDTQRQPSEPVQTTSRGRRRQIPQRFDQNNTSESREMAYRKRKRELAAEALLDGQKSKKKRTRFYLGPEPESKAWELVANGLEDVEELIASLKSLGIVANRRLVKALGKCKKEMLRQDDTITKELQRVEARQRRKEMMKNLPRKRSTRISAQVNFAGDCEKENGTAQEIPKFEKRRQEKKVPTPRRKTSRQRTLEEKRKLDDEIEEQEEREQDSDLDEERFP